MPIRTPAAAAAPATMPIIAAVDKPAAVPTPAATAAMFTGIVAVAVCPAWLADTAMLNVLCGEADTGPVDAMPCAFVVSTLVPVPFTNDADPLLICVNRNVTVSPATGVSFSSVTRITDSELTIPCRRFCGLPAAVRISILNLGPSAGCACGSAPTGTVMQRHTTTASPCRIVFISQTSEIVSSDSASITARPHGSKAIE